ncbi:IS1 family transposase [Halorubrum alkaliphilum]|uniref:IS1 family transposase n=1 Tax=Halorubrum alkaliphilum TaxID=261290 RepID=A0A8T4GKL0_9EURY|nr:transposase [Halorubrum alkaliphilum]MBP1924140.1 IS1 family transposase [Halorubrum alkaliphilum]
MTTSAPTGTIVPTNEELPVLRLSQPECPDCGGPVSRNGGYERHPQGCQPLRVQRYICANCRSFSPTHPAVADDHHYPRAVTQLATTIDVLTDSSLENRQDVLTIHYNVRPSDQQIHNWCTEQTAEIVANDLPVVSGVFTYDEQYLTIDGSRAYRLTVYDELLRAPVAETIADRCTKETVREFLTTVLGEKPVHVVTTDGRSDYPEIIEDELDAVHHRCNFHFLKNGEKKLRNTVFESVRYANTERLRGAIVWSEFKQVFAAQSYEAAVRRFGAVLDKIEQLPKELRTAVKDVMEEFDTFLGHLRHEAVPSTTNNLERYYGHTKPTQIKRRFRSDEHARAFLKQQMYLRTLKQGLMSRERSLSLGRKLFPAVSIEQLEPLFTESKQRYLLWRDRETD